MAMNKDENKSLSIPLDDPYSAINNFEALQPKLNKTEMDILAIWMTTSFRSPTEVHDEYENRWPDRCPEYTILCKWLKKLKQKALAFNRSTLREQLLFEYEVLFKEAYQAWLNSKEDEVTVTDITEESDKGYKHSTAERSKPQTGNPAHWKNAHTALAAIREMAGVDEPKRIETILRHEMDLILQYMEITLDGQVFEKVMNVLVQYDVEKANLIE